MIVRGAVNTFTLEFAMLRGEAWVSGRVDRWDRRHG